MVYRIRRSKAAGEAPAPMVDTDDGGPKRGEEPTRGEEPKRGEEEKDERQAPVARPPIRTRIRMFVREHPAVAWETVLALLLAIAAFAATWWLEQRIASSFRRP